MIKQSETEVRRAKIFWNGRSQAVRLPKEFRFDGDEVEISRDGEAVLLTPLPRTHFSPEYWDRIDGLLRGDALEDVEPMGGTLLDPDDEPDAQ